MKTLRRSVDDRHSLTDEINEILCFRRYFRPPAVGTRLQTGGKHVRETNVGSLLETTALAIQTRVCRVELIEDLCAKAPPGVSVHSTDTTFNGIRTAEDAIVSRGASRPRSGVSIHFVETCPICKIRRGNIVETDLKI